MDRLERLVNLVAALIDTGHPLTRAELRQRIEGYSDDPDAFRRNFERDKDLLRQMGFPLITVAVDPNHPDDVGYRIPRDQYELPDPGLDESELAALRLAASAVQLEGEWGGDAVIRALRKLGGAVTDDNGEVVARPGASGLAALPGEDTAAVAYGAIAERRRIAFDYRGQARSVEPWRLSYHRGRWYLSGFDRGRGGERLYRLDRIDGPVTTEGPADAYARPSNAQTKPPPAWRLGEEKPITARLWVDAEQARWATRALGEEAVAETRPDGSVQIDVVVTNSGAFRSFVLGFLDHAEILGPPDLRQGMVDYLTAIAAAGAAAGS